MLFLGSSINICDKSGIKVVKYISGFSYKFPGFIIKGICKKIKSRKKFSQGNFVSVFIISTFNQYKRDHYFFRSFLSNGFILDKFGNPISKILNKFFCHSLRRRRLFKILSLSDSLVV
jgi:ribosomal protein L14